MFLIHTQVRRTENTSSENTSSENTVRIAQGAPRSLFDISTNFAAS
jgi:hypothetical protein